MTDRIHALTVVLDHDIRDDDVQVIVDAIKQIRCVSSVGLNIVEPVDWAAREKVKEELCKKLYDFWRENFR